MKRVQTAIWTAVLVCSAAVCQWEWRLNEEEQEQKSDILRRIAEESVLAEDYLQEKEKTEEDTLIEEEMNCVLEIPALGIFQGVYRGTQEEIMRWLDLWKLAAADQDMELGKRGIVIYGHNYPGYPGGLGGLAQICIGDQFFLTNREEQWCFQVESISVWNRQEAVERLVRPILPESESWLLTCARNPDGSNAGTYLAVRGTLRKIVKLRDE